jgi:hypothetical protein
MAPARVLHGLKQNAVLMYRRSPREDSEKASGIHTWENASLGEDSEYCESRVMDASSQSCEVYGVAHVTSRWTFKVTQSLTTLS